MTVTDPKEDPSPSQVIEDNDDVEEDEEDVAEVDPSGTGDAKKKKKKKKPKKKKKAEQSDPPRVGLSKFFPTGIYPEGELQVRSDLLNTKFLKSEINFSRTRMSE